MCEFLCECGAPTLAYITGCGGVIVLLIGGTLFSIGIRHERYYSDSECLVINSRVTPSRCGPADNPKICYDPEWDVEYNRSSTLHYSTVKTFLPYKNMKAAIRVLGFYPVSYLLQCLTLIIFNFICRLTQNTHATMIIVRMKRMSYGLKWIQSLDGRSF